MHSLVDRPLAPAPSETAHRHRLCQEAIRRASAAPSISPRIAAAGSRAAEGLLVLATAAITAWIYPGLGEAFFHYAIVATGAALAVPALAQAMRLYSMQSLMNPLRSLPRLALSWTGAFAAIAVMALMSKTGETYSRLWLAGWFASGLLLNVVLRVGMAALTRRWNRDGRLSRNAVILGGGGPAAELASALAAAAHSDIRLVGVFDDRGDERSPSQLGLTPKLGDVAALVDFVRRARIDVVLVALPLHAEERLLQILKRLSVLPVDIRLSAYAQKIHYCPRSYSWIGNVPFLDVFDKPLGEWGAILKSAEDKVIALVALILLSPVMLLVALAVRLDSKGPILFRQKRFGFNNELIGVYKFRSMYHEMQDADATKLVTRGDPRVTRVGRFIRKTSLDELPQLFNVLRGELSLVGPRPHPTGARAADRLYTEVIDGYFARHKVKPGITGWAQVNGWRGETDTVEKLQRRVEHDLHYIENWSIAFDLYILLRTPVSLLKTENSY
ncbi:undecaprenyl-phosphate glucose phosphotransferase [Aestuariivirga sp.]|uniref:undecaprenyl-phosphate glucose phosphotransferase n=1 Tax=Aestuariivirga sp. TaxID=2650926 RepID=UPI00391B9B91